MKGKGIYYYIKKRKMVAVSNQDPIPKELTSTVYPFDFDKISLGTRKPDEPFYCRGKPKAEPYITFLGDVKYADKGSGSHFEPKAKGYIFDFLLELMRHQPYRPFAYGFLTDSRRFQFFKIEKSLETFKFKESSVMIGRNKFIGWQVNNIFLRMNEVICVIQLLFGMMTATLEELGYMDVSVPEYNIIKLIGSGAHGLVYEAINSSNGSAPAVALKLFTTGNDNFQREVIALTYLKDETVLATNGFIPDILLTTNSSCGWNVIVETPIALLIGSPKNLRGREVSDVCRTLRAIHEAGFYHGDVKPANVMYNSAKNVAMLIDFVASHPFDAVIEKRICKIIQDDYCVLCGNFFE
jgi:hypothetical protein